MSTTLFSEFKCRGLVMPNRICMAPMTRSFSPNGVPGENVAEYYERRAANNVGLIITEGTVIDREASANDPNYPMFHGTAPLAGWRQVAKKVHAAGGKIAPQLWHVGMLRKPGTGHNPEAQSDSPSGLTHTGKAVMPPPTDSEIDDMVASYARSAAHAKDLGFDALEIHGAHGYLIDQFFWDVMNKRDDRFGGELAQRANFAANIIRECRKAVGEDMPIILRISQWKQQDYAARLADTPEKLEAFLNVFVEAGVDVLHCSQRRYWEAEFEGSDLNFAGWAKKLTGLPTITVGSVGLDLDFFGFLKGEDSSKASLDELHRRLDRGDFDLVAVGRALLQDPEWVTKVKEGRMDELQGYDGAAIKTLY